MKRRVNDTYLWHWLVNHGIPKREIDGQSTNFLLYLYTWKSSRWNEKKSNLNDWNREWLSLNQSPELSQFIDPELFEWRGVWLPLYKDLAMLSKFYTLNFSPSLPQRDIQPFPRVIVLWGKGDTISLATIGHWLWTDANSRRTKMSTSQSRGLWRPGDQWSFSSGLFPLWVQWVPKPILWLFLYFRSM